MLLLFSCSVMSNSLWLPEQQHTRLPCPSPISRACSNPCPSSQWCHPSISSSVIPFSSRLQSFPASFPVSWLIASGGQSIRASVSSSVLPMNIQDWFPLGLIGRKALKLFVVTTVPCEWQKPSAKDMCLTACPPHPPKAVHPKGNQPWIFIGRTDAQAETPILWPPHAKRPWCWARLKAGEGDDRGWDGWMASQTLRTWVWESPEVGDGQGSLTRCSPWCPKESNMTERLNWYWCRTWKIVQMNLFTKQRQTHTHRK